MKVKHGRLRKRRAYKSTALKGDSAAAVAKEIGARHPAAKKAIVQLRRGRFRPTQAFQKALQRSGLPVPVKGQLIHLSLGDLSPTSKTRRIGLTADRYLRSLEYLEGHPESPLRPFRAHRFTRDSVPKMLARYFGSPRLDVLPLIRRLLLDPYYQATVGGYNATNLPFQVTRVLHERMRESAAPMFLTVEAARRLIRTGLSPQVTSYFFDGTHPVIALRNSLVYAYALLAADEYNGKAQNKIPVCVSRALGCRRLSLPELRCTMDLAGLVLAGVLAHPADVRVHGTRAETKRTLEMLQAHRAVWDFDAIGRLLFSLHIVGSRQVARIMEGKRTGAFGNAFLFNTRRAVTKRNDLADLRSFRPFYGAVSDEKLRNALAQHAPGRRFAHALRAQKKRFPRIAQRDLYNILLFGMAQQVAGHKPEHRLPPVARWALGEPERQPTGKGSVGRKKRRRQTVTRSAPLPEMDRLLKAVAKPAGCLLYPGYAGAMPKKLTVFIPRSIAKGYRRVPERAVLVGKTRVCWGESAYARSNLPELKGWRLRALRP